MKIDLAVWTAVKGYDWQPGSVYSSKELVGYKNEIGPLEEATLPLGGLFLKDGRAVFYRVQIAERMDFCGRDAIYCVLGTVPEDRAKEIDFSVVFNSAEMAQPQKPFPTAIEYNAEICEFKSPLGRSAFEEKRFTGSETFSELGGWCEEAKGGKLNVKITGSIDTPLFTVNYKPHVEPAVVPPKSPPPPPQTQAGGYRDVPPCQPHQQPVRQILDRYMADLNNQPFNYAEKPVKTSHNSFLNGFVAGTIFGIVVTAIVALLFLPSRNCYDCASNTTATSGLSNDNKGSVRINNEWMTKNGAKDDLRSHIQDEKAENIQEPTLEICPKCGGKGSLRVLSGIELCLFCGGNGKVRK